MKDGNLNMYDATNKEMHVKITNPLLKGSNRGVCLILQLKNHIFEEKKDHNIHDKRITKIKKARTDAQKSGESSQIIFIRL